MKKLILFICVIAAASITWHKADAGTSVWDFNKPKSDKDWKTVTGNWDLKDGAYQVKGNTPAMHSLVGDPKWTDYTIEAKVRMDRGNWAGLVVRAQSDLEYYVYYMNVPDNKSELWRHSKPNIDTRANSAQIPAVGGVKIANATWLNFKVVVEGDKLQLWINDKLQHEGKDNTYAAGQAGVWAWDTDASFDDVKITGKGIPDNLAVESAGKLSVVWGRMKER